MTKKTLKSGCSVASRPAPVIIPVASGKGGVGKSFLTANLAMALARLGRRTIAADLDFGGSNLHSFLGLGNKYAGIGDFLAGGAASLESLLVDTAVPGLRFLPGDGRTPFLANMTAAQKQKLIRHLRALPAEYVLLDLGAGSSFGVLDFFDCAPLGLAVTTPELPAIMGMQVFLKNHLLRRIDRQLSVNGCRAMRPVLKDLLRQPREKQLPSITALQSRLSAENPESGQAVAEVVAACRPRVVFNMGTAPEDSKLAHAIRASLGEVLAIEPDFFGFVFQDASVRSALAARKPFLPSYPESAAARSIGKLAERIVKYWSSPIPDSASRMSARVLQDREVRDL